VDPSRRARPIDSGSTIQGGGFSFKPSHGVPVGSNHGSLASSLVARAREDGRDDDLRRCNAAISSRMEKALIKPRRSGDQWVVV
jgi:hypothetical protein